VSSLGAFDARVNGVNFDKMFALLAEHDTRNLPRARIGSAVAFGIQPAQRFTVERIEAGFVQLCPLSCVCTEMPICLAAAAIDMPSLWHLLMARNCSLEIIIVFYLRMLFLIPKN